MIYFAIRILILIGVTIGTCPAYAAQPPDQPRQTPSATPSRVAAAPVVPAPSPDVLKRAKLAGYRVKKLRDGTTAFCKQESHVGTRFSTSSCIDENQLEELLLRAQSQRDSMNNRVGTQSNTK
jgi:hypothetical protein